MKSLEHRLKFAKDETQDDLLDLLPGYFQNRENDLVKLKLYVNEHDYEGVYQIAHKVLGTARSYGLEKLDVIANELEYNSKHELNEEKVKKAIVIFESYLKDKSI